ncbi:hypothetical protein U0070_007113 [Myodes glareolus]|uniref:Uncharacterized protein n=1 Tax=Myodes glareolus TaxID=447135 RepID=A0AAW0HKY8_MYOGA
MVVKAKASVMAQWIKMLAIKADDPSSGPRTHMEEGEKKQELICGPPKFKKKTMKIICELWVWGAAGDEWQGLDAALRCGRRCSSAAGGASSAWRASSVNAEDREFDDTALKFLVWSTRYEPFVEPVCKLCADELKVKRRH